MASRSHLTRPAAARRHALARVLALAALTGQAGGLLHAALVPHVTCFGHGDLVHVSDAPAVADLSAWPTLRDAVGADEESHDRCLLDEDGEQAPPSVAPRALPVAAASLAPRALEGTPPPLARGPLYRIAPKNSPPA